jgi:tape measure domain-containing protein
MASRRSDVELRIRAKNLASKDIRDLDDDLNRLVKTQERQGDAAALASRSLKELNAEQKELSKIAAELSRRKNIVEDLIGRQSELNAAKAKLNAIRRELAELLQQKQRGTFLGDIDKAIKNVRGELARATKDFDRTSSAVDKMSGKLREVGINTEDTAAALTSVTSSLNRAQAALIDQTADINRYANAQDNAAASARKLAEAQRFANEQLTRQQTRRADAVAGFANLDEFERQRREMQQNAVAAERMRGIHERLSAVLERQAQSQARVEAATGGATAAIRRQAAAVDAGRQSLDRWGSAAHQARIQNTLLADTGRKSLSVYQRLRGQVLSAVAAYVGLYEAVNLLASAMKASQKRAAITAQLGTVNNGDPRRIAEDQRFLRQEAERLGLVYDDLASKYANFAISAKAAGLGDSATKEAFSQAADIVVGMRLAAEDADGVFRAFVQIMSKSRVQAEELRGQLGDRLPGAVAAFAKANNLALSDLDEFLKKGKGNVQTFLNFLQEYAKTVKGSVEEGAKTLFADINRLKTAYNDFLVLVANSGTETELQKAVQSLTNALKGDAGARFARDLAAAFTQVIRALQFVVENFDTFMSLLKAFLALQVAKAVFGVGVAFVTMGTQTVTAVKSMNDFYKSAVAAKTAGQGLTLGMRALLALLGPVGIALAAAAGTFYALARAADAADERMRVFNNTLDNVLKAASTFDLDIAVADAKTQLQQVTSELGKLETLRDRVNDGFFPTIDKAVASMELMGDNIHTMEMLEVRISEEQAKQAALQNTINAAIDKRTRLKEEEAAADEARRKEEEAAANAARVDPEEEEKDKGPTDAQIMAAENRRLNAARAISKELLNLDQEIIDARLDAEARTVDEVQQRYALAIQQIESQIAEKQLELDQLAQNAATAGGGTISETDASGIALAREKLGVLQATLNTRAMEASYLSEIAIGEKAINDLIAERDAKIDAINTKVELGLLTEVEGRREAMAVQQEYAAQITANIDALIALLNTLPPDLSARIGVPKLIADLEAAKLRANEVQTTFMLIGKNLGGQFAQGVANAFGTLAKGLAGAIQGVNSIADAFKAAGEAFLTFLADFLVGIAQAIIQAIILKAIMNAISGGSGGYIDAAMGALTNHDGGVVGQDGTPRWVPQDAFKKAKRYHNGGLPGLKSNEVATILEKGEEVVTADNPRHIANAGAAGAGAGQGGALTINNYIDPDDMAQAVFSSKSGGQMLMNHIKANKQQIVALLGVK